MNTDGKEKIDEAMTPLQAERWEGIRSQGLAKYLLLRGALAWGGSMTVALSAVAYLRNPGEFALSRALATNLPACVLGGIAFGLLNWAITERRYRKHRNIPPRPGFLSFARGWLKAVANRWRPLTKAITTKRLIVGATATLALGALVWGVPVVVGAVRATPLQGSFLIARCACGHDVFYQIEGEKAYDYCPGHRDKRWIGPVTREGDRIRIFRARDSALESEIKLEGGDYYLKFPRMEEWHEVERITNPWRTSLRVYFPE